MIRLKTYSFRFAELVLNARLAIKQEIERILQDPSVSISELSRPRFNEVLDDLFRDRGWKPQPQVFPEPKDPSAKMDFLKDRIGVEEHKPGTVVALMYLDTGSRALTARHTPRNDKRSWLLCGDHIYVVRRRETGNERTD